MFERGHFCGYQLCYLVLDIKSVESISMRTQPFMYADKKNF